MSQPQERNDFQALFEVTRVINAIIEPAPLFDAILDIAMSHLEAERGVLLLSPENGTEEFTVAAARPAPESSAVRPLSTSVVREVLAKGEPVLTFDALSDERFEAATSIVSQRILSIVCIPLRTSNRVVGAMYLDSTRSRRKFTDDSLRFLTVFGTLAAIAVYNAQEYDRLRTENRYLRNQVETTRRFPGIIGESRRWRDVLEKVERLLDVDVAVLIMGESGTGKEVIARAIHEQGARRTGPFVTINCSAIPNELLESELFGHKKGSFTGAVADKKGLFELAKNGTLFLDEIGEMPANLQGKLLRVLEDREVRPVGDTVSRKINVRIVAATNKPLEEEVAAKRFREDLFFRLNVVSIILPPLRERREDIPQLSSHFVKSIAQQYKRPVQSIDPGAMQALLAHQWKGNVRELRNMLERAVVLSNGETLTAADLFPPSASAAPQSPIGMTLAESERRLIEATLAELDGNRTKTAERLGVSLRWLQYRLKEWGI